MQLSRRKECRKDVEPELDLSLAVEYFGVGAIAGKLIAFAEGMPPPSGETTVATDRARQLWKSTIGVKMSHIPFPHRRKLVTGAELRQGIRDLRRVERQVSQLLGSPSRAYAIKANRGRIQDFHDIVKAFGENLASRHYRLTRGGEYRDAVWEFWGVINQTDQILHYCLAPTRRK